MKEMTQEERLNYSYMEYILKYRGFWGITQNIELYSDGS